MSLPHHTASKKPQDPNTPQEWQEAINRAVLFRALHASKFYGMVEGGPTIDIDRCDEIFAQAIAQGYRPNATLEQLLAGYIQAA